MSRKSILVISLAVAVSAAIGFGAAVAMSHMHGEGEGYAQMHAKHHGGGQQGMMHGGPNHTEHDEVNMPGLRGLNASAEESAEIAVLFNNFQTIERSVVNLPNGIKTVTHSADPQVMEALVSHVVGMIGRVEMKDDPQIMIQSPTLEIFFERADALVTEIDVTEEGIIVLQTSEDPELVAAMHLHAAEVSAMADRGMQAVHEMMAARGDGH